jgi:hypothetical protein
MGDKYSPEDLERLRSVAYNSGGRIRHNQAGVPMRVVKDSLREKVTVDENNSVYTDKADGTQDLTLNPKPVKAASIQAPTE